MFLHNRKARTTMKPGAEEDMYVSKRILGNSPKIVPDEVINGEYGLVINGHSLVRAKASVSRHM